MNNMPTSKFQFDRRDCKWKIKKVQVTRITYKAFSSSGLT